LNNNYLYIVDDKDIYAFDFSIESLIKIDIGKYKLNDPYGIIIDKNKNLIVTEPYLNEINYFVPKNELYRNLDVKLEKIDISSYPIVMAYISVKDQTGNAIYGLGNNNFIFKEIDTEISRVESNYTELMKEKLGMSIIVETNKSMKNNADKIQSVLNDLFDNNSENIVFNSYTTNYEQQLKEFNENSVSIKNKYLAKDIFNNKTATDISFYTAISSTIREFMKTGIIYITDGNFSDNSFVTYSRNDIINYAKNNYIPIYVFYIGDGQGEAFLKEMAQKTMGKFYNLEDYKQPEIVFHEFKNYNNPYYLVYYISPYFYAEDFFRKVFVTVQYNGRVGKNWLGYYMYKKY